jgi:hypothetical protein
MEGSDIRNLNLFSKLVREGAFPHVVVVTTIWGDLDEAGKKSAQKTEKKLKENFWSEMIQEGS